MLEINLNTVRKKPKAQLTLMQEALLGLLFMLFCGGITYWLIQIEQRTPSSPASLRREIDALRRRVEQLEKHD